MSSAAEKIVDMNGNKFHPEVIRGNIKLRADGKPKNTRPNCKTGRSTWVDPIRNKEDIKKVLDYLQNKIDNEPRVDYRRAWARNKMYFCIGVFSGFRVSDLIGLKWQDIYCKDGKTFRKEIGIIEKKTGKVKQLRLSEVSKKFVQEYVGEYQPDTSENGYLFLNRQKKQINRQTVDDFIKEATTACGIEGTFSTHSVRKTFVYQYFMALKSVGDDLALEKCQRICNHAHSSDTLRYLGLKNQQEEADLNVMENYMDF